MRIAVATAVAVAVTLVLGACGSSPAGPTQPPPPPPPPANNLPVIDSITVQGRRPNEPANFTDLTETIDVAAKVHDDETPVDQLQLKWSAPVGTFDGSGPNVTWTAPASVTTPMDVTITLTVTEKYGFPGGPLAYEHSTDGSAALSLHDSVKEVGDMARQFLLDFSDSRIDVGEVMRNFDPACDGTREETQQVTANRKTFQIAHSNIGQPSVRIPFGNAFCSVPGRIQRGDACSDTPVHWESTIVANGRYQVADGTDWVSAYYRPALKVWKLCDSQFTGICIDVTTGRPCTDDVMKAMVAGAWRRSDSRSPRPPSE